MATYKRQRYLMMTLDPVHIGTGGYRLGRVDNSIVREPGTRVPKIPGTALHGAIRSYAAQVYETPEAAGQSQDAVEDPDKNPVCYTFGYIKKKSTERDGEERTIAYSGVINIFDAHIVLFPVYSITGPVWVSTLNRLKDAGFKVQRNGPEHQEADSSKALLTWDRTDALNLGWLMVDTAGKVTVTAPEPWKEQEQWKMVSKRIVLVNELLFSHIVTSNLEVRTSVSINPQTGAAEEGALFTYEAIPRATFLTMDVVLDDYREAFPKEKCGQGKTHLDTPLPGVRWEGPLDVVRAGLRMIEWLGVGGMGTRGFGRMTIVGEPTEQKHEGTRG